MSILERLLYQQGRAARTSERQRGSLPAGETGAHKPDMLPLAEDASGKVCQTCSVLVAVTGEALDDELMALACTVAKEKHSNIVHAIYGIEVPRTKAVDDEMPTERQKADVALKRAAEDAKSYGIGVDKEYIQSRNFGQSLVDAAASHGCALLIIGVPYQTEAEGQFELTETADYVLKHAPCRVWAIRGSAPADAEPSSEDATPAEPAIRR